MPRKPSIELPDLERLERPLDLGARGRQDERRRILQKLGQDAAGADDQRQAELRIGFEADDQFGDGARHHALDEHLIGASFAMRAAAARDFVGGLEIERDAAGFGLVRDGGATRP